MTIKSNSETMPKALTRIAVELMNAGYDEAADYCMGDYMTNKFDLTPDANALTEADIDGLKINYKGSILTDRDVKVYHSALEAVKQLMKEKRGE